MRMDNVMTSRLRFAVVWAAIITAPLATAANAQVDESRLSPGQITTVQETCSNTLRVGRGTVQYEACTESLSRVLANQNQVTSLTRSYDECARTHRDEQTPEFATCVLDRKEKDAVDISSHSQQGGNIKNDVEISSKSFSSSNFDERHRKEEYACAKLGLVPGRVAFNSCVTSLDVNMWNAANTGG